MSELLTKGAGELKEAHDGRLLAAAPNKGYQPLVFRPRDRLDQRRALLGQPPPEPLQRGGPGGRDLLAQSVEAGAREILRARPTLPREEQDACQESDPGEAHAPILYQKAS